MIVDAGADNLAHQPTEPVLSVSHYVNFTIYLLHNLSISHFDNLAILQSYDRGWNC